MILFSSVHNHTTFCDGDNTPEDMVSSAIQKGITTLGLLFHGYTAFDEAYCCRDSDGFFAEMERLKKKYAGKIELLSGVERDYYGIGDARADYTIVSVHYLLVDGKYYAIDDTPEKLALLAKKIGGAKALVDKYYETVSLSAKLKPDIVGHFDLIKKFNKTLSLFSESDDYYIKAALCALDALKDCTLELNLGGYYGDYCLEPYPSAFILGEMNKRNMRVIITNDAHNTEMLGKGYDYARSMLISAGYEEETSLCKNGKVVHKLEI